MHGGVAALGATLSVFLLEGHESVSFRLFVPGVLASILLHSLFNQNLESPVASTIAEVVGIPVILAIVFYFSEKSLRNWLGGKLDRDIDRHDRVEGIPGDPGGILSYQPSGSLSAGCAW